ncbi:chitinase domain-containing protein 1 [Cavenderia fasciculata]|uniref:Chitinase domain-containing protein 1 n=1 Tax=Cavenderia fasciculata TaxID=261658 RepID=F4PWF0_CACFS|nr:chitinase domain-containing protein 1 [Cavenderia fasciculata]EGG20314.1 chitinase domain-containing protein 1 [Cavenderia fasciculata]|eukprot:XP_004367297.1 chitinase domain-containing protein 1 [Cavenderia fasciculata]
MKSISKWFSIILIIVIVTLNVTSSKKIGDRNKDSLDSVLEVGDDGDLAVDYSQPWSTKKNVVKRNLVRENFRPSSIIKNYLSYYEDTSKRLFDGNVLAYVTPWNKHGYEIAERFKHKFTHVSPVWHQIKWDGKKTLIQGDNNYDKKWIDSIRDGSQTKVVPRYQFDGQNWNTALAKVVLDDILIDQLINDIKKNDYDGLVLEGIVPYFKIDKKPRNQFIERLYKKIQSIKKQLFIVVPPIDRGQLFTNEDFHSLVSFVDGFSLMTYDYDPSQASVSPLPWVEHNLRGVLAGDSGDNVHKVMMGIPFYGYRTTLKDSPAVLGNDYIEMIKKYKPKRIDWSRTTHEHTFTYQDEASGNTEQKVTYPSLLFIQERIQLAKQYQVSISIWEIGQGLDYFYDLL